MRISELRFVYLLIYIIIQTTLLLYPQELNAVVTINKNPSKDYLFLGLTTGEFNGSLWIVDNDLTPVFYKKIKGFIYNFTYQPNGELTYFNITTDSENGYGMDSSGTLINQFITPEGYPLDVHELQVLNDGSYYILSKEIITIDMSQYVANGETNAILNSNTIHYMDSKDKEIWRWSAFDHYNILDVDDYIDLTQPQIDWTHCNAIEVDTDGNILLSTRNFDEVTKIDRKTGAIIWRLGGKKNQFRFINDTLIFMRQHDVRRRSNGNLMMFDNGHYRLPRFSSYVEYKLNEDSLTATLVRRYSRNESVYSDSRGGVEELPNGNTLISWGLSEDPSVTEFGADDSIEFEINFTTLTHQYRAYRFPWETNYFFVNTDSLNFGSISLGDSLFQNIWVKNIRYDSITINEFYFQDSAFSVTNELPIAITRNDSVKLVVKYKPYRSGIFHDKLNIRYVNRTLLLAKQVELYASSNKVTTNIQKQEGNKGYFLSQNYPNPFNPITKIKYTIPSSSDRMKFVLLKIYDILGNEVATLVNEKKPPGSYEASFNTETIGKVILTSGIYFYKLTVGDYSSTKKMILIK